MDLFREYLAQAIGAERALVVLQALSEDASTSLRLNPFKSPDGLFEDSEKVPWSPYGRILSLRPNFTLDPLFHAGAYYVQDSSAQYPGHVFRSLLPEAGRPLRVLDLCAAPGGKTTDLAASLRAVFGDSFLLVANEVVRSRVSVLADNAARWGDPCVVVTSVDPAAFSPLKGFFDIILADVPCSGEGMFRKDEQARKQWSPDNVALCAARQKRIISDVWDALAEGGKLIYSTCTFNRREDDDMVAWIAETLDAEPLECDIPFDGVLRTGYGALLAPGFVSGEGQYCAALIKKNGTSFRPRRKAAAGIHGPFEDMVEGNMRFASKGDTVIAIPQEIASLVEEIAFLHPLSAGVAVCSVKGRDMVPHADLALGLALRKAAFPVFEASRDMALSFLHKDTINISAPNGYVLIEYSGTPLGFVKNLGNRCNNLLPQGRRIRMDI